MFNLVTMLRISLQSHYQLRHSENMFTTFECVINKTYNDRLLEGELLSCTLFTLLWFFPLGFPRKVFNETTKMQYKKINDDSLQRGVLQKSSWFRKEMKMEPMPLMFTVIFVELAVYIRDCNTFILLCPFRT